MTLCLHHIYVGNNIFVRGSPSARSKMEYLLLDYKRQRGGAADAGSRERWRSLCRTRKGKGRVKSSTRKNDPQNEGKGKGEGQADRKRKNGQNRDIFNQGGEGKGREGGRRKEGGMQKNKE